MDICYKTFPFANFLFNMNLFINASQQQSSTVQTQTYKSIQIYETQIIMKYAKLLRCVK